MIISDLNYLEATEGSAVVGGSYFNVYKDVYVDKDIYVNIYKDIKAEAKVKGNIAEAEGLAKAYGDNSFTNTLTYTETTGYSSTSLSESDSATY